MDLNTALAVTKVDFSQVSSMLNSIRSMTYARKLETYVHFCADRVSSAVTATQSSILQSFRVQGTANDPNSHTPSAGDRRAMAAFSTFSDKKGYCDQLFNPKYLKGVFEDTWDSGLRQYCCDILDMAVSSTICVDHTFYLPKHVILPNGQRPWFGLLTIMDTKDGKILAQQWTRSKTLEEATPAMELLRDRLRRWGVILKVIWRLDARDHRRQ